MKWLIPLLLLFCASCHHSHWKHSSLRSGNPDQDLAKLIYPASNQNSGIEVEITRFGREVHGYINVKHFTLPLHDGSSHETTLTIGSRSFVITLLEGGQRARLTENCLDYLIQSLELKASVLLTSGHFSESLDATNFRRHYDALLRNPRRLLPQNLVTFEFY